MTKRILIVRPDAIGDFLYLVHHLNSLITDEKVEIYYLGNKQNTSLAEVLLNKKIRFIGLDRQLLYHDTNYFKTISQELSALKFEKVIYASCSRELFIDALIFSLNANWTYGFYGDLSLVKALTRKFTSLLYTRVLHEKSKHEHINLKQLFGEVFKQNYQLKKTTYKSNQSKFINDTKSFVVLFPGASIIGKQWPLENFLKLANELEKKYAIVWLGGELERKLIISIKADRPNDIILIGQTSLMQSFEIISGANLLISNDTSAVHMGEIANVKTVCLLGGGHFHRFLPYPENFSWKTNIKSVFVTMPCFSCQWQCPFLEDNGRTNVFPCVGNIGVDQVFTALLKEF